MQVEEPANREETRNPDGTFKPGVSGNPNGRPKGTLKDFVRQTFQGMTDDEKREWLKKNKVPADLIWRMAEGNPSNELEHKGEILTKVISIDE